MPGKKRKIVFIRDNTEKFSRLLFRSEVPISIKDGDEYEDVWGFREYLFRFNRPNDTFMLKVDVIYFIDVR